MESIDVIRSLEGCRICAVDAELGLLVAWNGSCTLRLVPFAHASFRDFRPGCDRDAIVLYVDSDVMTFSTDRDLDAVDRIARSWLEDIRVEEESLL